jgi:hypothetical protein
VKSVLREACPGLLGGIVGLGEDEQMLLMTSLGTAKYLMTRERGRK